RTARRPAKSAPSMKRSAFRPRSLFALCFVAILVQVACSRQEEGQRCVQRNDNEDCEAGLICVGSTDLRSSDGVDRCCPPEGSPVSDARCIRLAGGGNDNGNGNEGGEGGEASSTTGVSGAPCTHTSQCPEGTV